MKKNLTAVLIMMSSLLFAQDSLKTKNAFLTVNPEKVITKQTAGINVGVMDLYKKQKINGVNIQANPITLLYPLFPKAVEAPSKSESTVSINGLHVSTGGMLDGEKLNGLGISAYHHCRVTNGVSFNFFNNTSNILNGFHVSGFSNDSQIGNGVTASVLGNYSSDFKGLQISVYNQSKKLRGVQIGLINKSENLKGIQIGLWNVNEKRKFPIINWNFKAKTQKP